MSDVLQHIELIRRSLDAIEEASLPAPSVPPGGEPPRWLQEARRHIGVRELPGDEHNDLILRWLATTTLGRWARERDETPWCSAFVNAMVKSAGLEGTDSAMARSWLGWGVDCPPRAGAIVVLRRGAPPSGHVGFVERVDEMDAVVHVLGGNQGNQVCVRPYPLSRVLSYRWTAEA